MKLEVGKNYFVRTVTDYWVGTLAEIDGPFTVTLIDLAWVENTGRLADFMRDGFAVGMEVEPYPDGVPQMTQYLAICPWIHPLLRSQV